MHVLIETENPTFVTFDPFTLDPADCDAQLAYSVLLNDTALPTNLNITLQDSYDKNLDKIRK